MGSADTIRQAGCASPSTRPSSTTASSD